MFAIKAVIVEVLVVAFISSIIFVLSFVNLSESTETVKELSSTVSTHLQEQQELLDSLTAQG